MPWSARTMNTMTSSPTTRIRRTSPYAYCLFLPSLMRSFNQQNKGKSATNFLYVWRLQLALLASLYLRRLCDGGLKHILTGCRSLVKVEVRNCPFGDKALRENRSMLEKLRSLSMVECSLTPPIPCSAGVTTIFPLHRPDYCPIHQALPTQVKKRGSRYHLSDSMAVRPGCFPQDQQRGMTPPSRLCLQWQGAPPSRCI